MVSAPASFRKIKLSSDKKLSINTGYISNVSFNTLGKSFQNYAKDTLISGLTKYIKIVFSR
jgi:hypothetical protein